MRKGKTHPLCCLKGDIVNKATSPPEAHHEGELVRGNNLKWKRNFLKMEYLVQEAAVIAPPVNRTHDPEFVAILVRTNSDTRTKRKVMAMPDQYHGIHLPWFFFCVQSVMPYGNERKRTKRTPKRKRTVEKN